MTKYTLELLNGDSCESRFRVRELDTVIRLWIIVGGTPAVSYEDYSFSERFDSPAAREKYKNWDSVTRRYPHQDDRKMPYPNPSDLPNGESDLVKWLDRTLPLRDLRATRAKLITQISGNRWGYFLSQRLHDKSNHCYFRVRWGDAYGPRSDMVHPVTGSSAWYGGRVCDNDRGVRAAMPESWLALTDYINPLFDRHYGGLETLSADEFARLCELLEGVNHA